MNVSETDIELLETYLDDELNADEGESLRQRLALDRSLSAAMDRLRGEREMRRHVFASLETDRGTEIAVRGVRRAAMSEIAWSKRLRFLRQISAAAACIVVGAAVGWIGRGPAQAPSTLRPSNAEMAGSESRATRNHVMPNANISLTGNDDLTRRLIGQGVIGQGVIGQGVVGQGGDFNRGGYNVAITDDFGRVLAVQHFDTLAEARDFSSDLGKWQNKQRQIRSGNVKLVGDEF